MSVSNPYQNEVIISWTEIHRDARFLSHLLLAKGPWKGIIAITKGGLIPAALIARELNIKFIDTVCISSYDGNSDGAAQNQKELEVIKMIEGDGEGFLLIDDLVDTGKTAKFIREKLPKAYFSTLYAKPEGKPLVDLYVKEFAQSEWIFFPWDIEYQFSIPIHHRPKIEPKA
jgi:xanthine phosphoribosyltransferase